MTPTSRRASIALVSVLLLAACGGGGTADPPVADDPPPRIARLDAGTQPVPVGDTLRVRVDYGGGQGRLEPGIGPVASGSEVRVGPLDRDVVLRLVVARPGRPDAVTELPVRVDFRDRYRADALRLAASRHAAVATGDGSVLLIGGSRGEPTLSARIDRYDPARHTMTHIGALGQGRAGAVAVRLDDGQVLVVGGELSGTDWRLAELVDERTGAVVPAGHLSVRRSGHAAVRLADGRVLVTGGTATGEGATLGLSRSAELWDPRSRTFRRLDTGMHQARSGHSASLLPDGRVLIVGGYGPALPGRFAELFDPATERFEPLPQAQPPRAEHAAFVQPDGGVLIVGGELAVPGQDVGVPTTEVLRYDPATRGFTALPPLAVARAGAAGVQLPGGDLLLFGGRQGDGLAGAAAERYDPRRGGVAIAPLDGPRVHHSVTRLPSGRIAVIGGEGRDGGFTTTVQVYE